MNANTQLCLAMVCAFLVIKKVRHTMWRVVFRIMTTSEQEWIDYNTCKRPLYFIQIDSQVSSCDNKDDYAKNCKIYWFLDNYLCNKGWHMIPWSNNFASYESSPELWFDQYHPKAELVIKMLIEWINAIKSTSSKKIEYVLIVGDSTVAECIKYEAWREGDGVIEKDDLISIVKKETGVTLCIFAKCGTYFTKYKKKHDFVYQCKQAVRMIKNKTYDAVLLVGGWNQVYSTNRKKLIAALDEFHTSAVSAL